MSVDWPQTFAEVEDHLFPRLSLSAWEKVVYYHLLRHTRAAGGPSGTFSVAGLAASASISEPTAREAIRSLHQKGCILVHERSSRGHLIEVYLPSEIPNLIPPPSTDKPIDLEAIDFYSDRRYLDALLQREGHKCFYSLREVTKGNCALDHVVPLVKGGDSSYRNVVVCSHDINALKQDQEADDFLRALYRKGMLSASELEGRIAALVALKAGQRTPQIS
jgi:hypothetical protein